MDGLGDVADLPRVTVISGGLVTPRGWCALSPAAGDPPGQRWGKNVWMVDMEIVAVVGSRIEAELIVGMLRSHGLRAVFAADDVGGQEPQLQMQGVRVLVDPSDEALARRLLAADESEGPVGGG
jgi:hypothetical protein